MKGKKKALIRFHNFRFPSFTVLKPNNVKSADHNLFSTNFQNSKGKSLIIDTNSKECEFFEWHTLQNSNKVLTNGAKGRNYEGSPVLQRNLNEIQNSKRLLFKEM